MLSDGHKRLVLEFARQAVVRQVTGCGTLQALGCEPPEAFGVFVTLKVGGALRGCLGTLDCGGELPREIERCAAEAASADPRFPAIGADELPDITIEVSLLGALEPIDPAEPAAIVVGRHGLLVEDGRRRGLLLPQVAIEWNWTREQFLTQTCLKAGLPADAWLNGARVYRFEAEVFGH